MQCLSLQMFQFYARAMLALAQEGDEVDLWMIGALVIERQLRAESDRLTDQFQAILQWIKHY
ncbi:MAG: hypothetical protein ACI9D5_000466 [Candidatus Endobugula sp.]|jgi:hypothetical protein